MDSGRRTERRTICFLSDDGRHMHVDVEYRITLMIDGSGAMHIAHRFLWDTLREVGV